MSDIHFGEHITIDGYGGNERLLGNKKIVYSALKDLCKDLGMHPLTRPVIAHAPDNHIKDPGGWSAFMMIVESHISIHTFPKRRFVSADIYTCQNGLDKNFVVEFFKKKFELEDTEVNFLKRGLKYPKENLL
jgi:S-adenosylmethionine decarboxylase